MSHDTGLLRWTVTALDGRTTTRIDDLLCVEEPLEVVVAIGDAPPRSAFTTLRTPGLDHELALGWLLSEGVIRTRADVVAIEARVDPERPLHQSVLVRLRQAATLAPLDRLSWASSACGVCGRTAISEVIEGAKPPTAPVAPLLPAALLFELPDRLRAAQRLFAATGSIHAAGFFDARGELLCAAEDIGRHNAVDKVIGLAAVLGVTPLVLVVSGRAGFEIVAKAARVGVPIVAAVGAPSSLSAKVALASGLTLVGFLRDGRANSYTFSERIGSEQAGPERREP